MAPPKDLKTILDQANKNAPAPKAAADRAKAINSLSGFITKQENIYSKEFGSIQKSVHALLEKSKQERMRGVGAAETIKEVESSVGKMMDKMGDLFQSVNKQLTQSTSAFYNLSKDTLNEYRDAIRQDISLNKTNTVAMALASSTPIFGYFVGKFMETSLFKKMTETIKSKFGSAISWVADKFKGVMAGVSTNVKSWFQRRAEAKAEAREMKKVGRLPKMQAGGYVARGGAVEVHRAEVITPVEKIFKYIEEKTGRSDLTEKVEYWIKEISYGVIDLEKFIKRERVEQRGFIESFLKNWQEERHFEEKDWRERVVRTLAELKTGLFGMTSAIRIAWQRTLMEHPTFRYMIAAAEVFKTVFVRPIKWLYGIKGGYKGMLPKSSNTLGNIQDTLYLLFSNMMPKLDQIALTLKELYEFISKEKATESKEATYTIFGKIKEFMTGKAAIRSPFDMIVEKLGLDKKALKEAGITGIGGLLNPFKAAKGMAITEGNIMDLFGRTKKGAGVAAGEAGTKSKLGGLPLATWFKRFAKYGTLGAIAGLLLPGVGTVGAGILLGTLGLFFGSEKKKKAEDEASKVKKPFAYLAEKRREFKAMLSSGWGKIYTDLSEKLSAITENTKKPKWYTRIATWLAKSGLGLLDKIFGLVGLLERGTFGLISLPGTILKLISTFPSLIKGALGAIFGGMGKLGGAALKMLPMGAAIGAAAFGVYEMIQAFRGEKTIVGEIFGYFGEWITKGKYKGPGWLGELVYDIVHQAGGKFASTIDSIVGSIGEGLDAVKKFLNTTVVEITKKVGSFMWEKAKDLVDLYLYPFRFVFDLAGKLKDWMVQKILEIPGVKQIIAAGKVVKEAATPIVGAAVGAGVGVYEKVAALVKSVNMEGLQPNVRENFDAMQKEYREKGGGAISVNSAYRTAAEQAELYRTLPKGQAAPPGKSLHEKGMAIDVSSVDAKRLAELGLLQKYGFTRPVPGEPWHLQYAAVGDHKQNKPYFTGKGLAASQANEMMMGISSSANLMKEIGDSMASSSKNMQSALIASTNVISNSISTMTNNSGRQSGGAYDMEIQSLLNGNLS